MTKPSSAASVAKALLSVLESPNEMDSNLEVANVVDGLFAIARAIGRLSKTLERLGFGDEIPPSAIVSGEVAPLTRIAVALESLAAQEGQDQ